MPHIRPDCAGNPRPILPPQPRRTPNSIAVRLTRDVLLLRSAGSSRRAIAAALNLSQRRVQTILDGAAPAVPSRRKPFVTRERDADYASVEAALRAARRCAPSTSIMQPGALRPTHTRFSGAGLRIG